MANGQLHIAIVPCPRDRPDHEEVLNTFRLLTPPWCDFAPARLWPGHTRKKKSTCRWHVLYTLKHLETGAYLKGTQARDLKHQLMQRKPSNCVVADYEFYEEDVHCGWLMTWRIHCNHIPDFCSRDNTPKEELLMITNK